MYAITGGTIFTMEDEEPGHFRTIRNGTVLVEAEKIRAVLDYEEVPPGFRQINAKDHIVMPGIIEAHCHMGISEEKKGMEGDDCNENVAPVTPFLRAIDAINPMDAAFHDAIGVGITGAMIGPGSSNVVGGQFAFLHTSGRSVDEMTVLAPAAMKVAFGENPKVNFSGQGSSPVTRMSIAAMLRKELSEVREAFEEKGAESLSFEKECWRKVFAKEIPLKAHVHRADDIQTAIRIAREFDLRMTLDHCSEGHLISDAIFKSGFPAIVGPDLASRNKIEVKNMAFKTAGILAKKGVMVAITTDHPVSLIASLPLCAGLAVKHGMPMESGLKAITCHAAKICGVDQWTGSLIPGKWADLVIYKGHPFELFSKAALTMIKGKIVYRDAEFFL